MENIIQAYMLLGAAWALSRFASICNEIKSRRACEGLNSKAKAERQIEIDNICIFLRNDFNVNVFLGMVLLVGVFIHLFIWPYSVFKFFKNRV